MPAAALLLAAASPAIGADRRYTVTDFDRIQIDGPFQVTLATGKSPSAIATGSAQALDRVAIDVQGRTLRVRTNRSSWGGYPGGGAGPLTIALCTHGLRAGLVTGSGSLSIDKARAMRFDASLAGNGRLTIGKVEADTLVLSILGSGKMILGGKVKDLRASVQGSGDLDAKALIATDARIEAATAGGIEVAVSNSAKVTSLGAGDIAILGSPSCTVTASGAGRVTCGD